MLLEYFRYFAWSFDYRHSVVSLRRHGMVIEKAEKYERAAWLHTDNLSIEDPFETWYDVAHVIKPTQMTYIRKEYLVRVGDVTCSAFDLNCLIIVLLSSSSAESVHVS